MTFIANLWRPFPFLKQGTENEHPALLKKFKKLKKGALNAAKQMKHSCLRICGFTKAFRVSNKVTETYQIPSSQENV